MPLLKHATTCTKRKSCICILYMELPLRPSRPPKTYTHFYFLDIGKGKRPNHVDASNCQCVWKLKETLPTRRCILTLGTDSEQAINIQREKVYLADATPVLLKAPRSEEPYLLTCHIFPCWGFAVLHRIQRKFSAGKCALVPKASDVTKPISKKPRGLATELKIQPVPMRWIDRYPPKTCRDGQSDSCATRPTPLKKAEHLFSRMKR